MIIEIIPLTQKFSKLSIESISDVCRKRGLGILGDIYTEKMLLYHSKNCFKMVERL